MHSIQETREAIHQSTLLLMKAIEPCHSGQCNQRPAGGGWSIGEVLEHLWLIESTLNQYFDGAGHPTERPIDKKVAIIAAAFEATGKQYESPGLFVPTHSHKEKNYWLEKLLHERQVLASKLEALDLSETLLAFKHPMLGAFTRYEWVCFIILHSNRHVKQIDKILAGLPTIDIINPG